MRNLLKRKNREGGHFYHGLIPSTFRKAEVLRLRSYAFSLDLSSHIKSRISPVSDAKRGRSCYVLVKPKLSSG